MSKYVIILILLCSISVPCWAADHYIRVGASGSNDGTDWTNAWHEMEHINWESVSPGDTIWIAGGNYTTALWPDKNGTSENRIYIKRVRTTDATPAAAAGWNAAYDATVDIDTTDNSSSISWRYTVDNGVGSYVTIDGRVESGITTHGYSTENASAVGIGHRVTGITLQYIDIAGPQTWKGMECTGDCTPIYIGRYTGTGTNKDININHCNIHAGCTLMELLYLEDPVFENNKIYDSYGDFTTYGLHANVIMSNGVTGEAVFRHNEIYNWQVEGIMLLNDNHQVWKIYGNLWHDANSTSSRLVEAQDGVHELYYHNNTAVNVQNGILTGNGGSWSDNSSSQNNIFWNAQTGTPPGANYNFSDAESITGANSISEGSNPFVDYSGKDYRIVSTEGAKYPVNKGNSLDAEYSTDILGVTRPKGSSWDIGAYEYNPSTTLKQSLSGGSLGGGSMR